MNFRYWFLEKGWVAILPIILAILGIWVWPNLYIPPVLTIDAQGIVRENTQTLYLLSSIAQSLAAILALVFTLSLIVFQLSSRYSQRLYTRFFNKFTIAYITLFIVSVLLPLWTIVKPYPYVVKLSLSLSAVCLFLLIPYFLSLRAQLSPEKTLENLYKKALQKIIKKSSGEFDEVITIDNFIMSAYSLRDYETCRIGINILAKLAYEANKQDEGKNDETSTNQLVFIYDRLNYIAISTIEDPRVPDYIAKEIWRNAVNGIQNNLEEVADVAQHRLTSIIVNTIDMASDYYISCIIDFISDIARKSIKLSSNLTLSCVSNLALTSNLVNKIKLKQSIASLIYGFANIGEESIKEAKEKVVDDSLNELFKFLGMVPYGLLIEKSFSKRVCIRLFRLGVLSLAYQIEKNMQDIIKRIKNLEMQLGSKFIDSAFDDIPDYWAKNWEEQIIQFREMYKKSN